MEEWLPPGRLLQIHSKVLKSGIRMLTGPQQWVLLVTWSEPSSLGIITGVSHDGAVAIDADTLRLTAAHGLPVPLSHL
jgi:hypothetical protein